VDKFSSCIVVARRNKKHDCSSFGSLLGTSSMRFMTWLLMWYLLPCEVNHSVSELYNLLATCLQLMYNSFETHL